MNNKNCTCIFSYIFNHLENTCYLKPNNENILKLSEKLPTQSKNILNYEEEKYQLDNHNKIILNEEEEITLNYPNKVTCTEPDELLYQDSNLESVVESSKIPAEEDNIINESTNNIVTKEKHKFYKCRF